MNLNECVHSYTERKNSIHQSICNMCLHEPLKTQYIRCMYSIFLLHFDLTDCALQWKVPRVLR